MKNLKGWQKAAIIAVIILVLVIGFSYWYNPKEDLDENGTPKPKDGRIFDTKVDVYKILERGMFSQNVKILQQQLNAKLSVSKGLGLPAVASVKALTVDGDFGAKTEGLLFILFGKTKTTLKTIGVEE